MRSERSVGVVNSDVIRSPDANVRVERGVRFLRLKQAVDALTSAAVVVAVGGSDDVIIVPTVAVAVVEAALGRCGVNGGTAVHAAATFITKSFFSLRRRNPRNGVRTTAAPASSSYSGVVSTSMRHSSSRCQRWNPLLRSCPAAAAAPAAAADASLIRSKLLSRQSAARFGSRFRRRFREMT